MRRFIILALAAASLTACVKSGDFDETGGVKIVRSSCPAVAIPAYTGDVTLFDPPASTDAGAIDVVATITNLRSTCTSAADPLRVDLTFDVVARRSNPAGAREVVMPYFSTVMRGGTQIVSKDVGRVALSFADGAARTTARATASATIGLAAATLDPNIQQQITRKRKPGDADAAIDPMADPAVRAAVQRAAFEVLVGFQLTQAQLGYNATR